jgi:hypothetical protein
MGDEVRVKMADAGQKRVKSGPPQTAITGACGAKWHIKAMYAR